MNGKTEAVFLAVLFVVAVFLFFFGLDKRLLWQDEAQTALISKTVLEKGVPMISDGNNSFSQEFGAEAGPDGIYKWHPWLSFYLVAGSYKIFGVNTFAARFPFALFGVLTVLMLYFLTKEASGSARAAAFAAVLLVLSPVFLVLAKQCRYYSPVMFFSLVALREYLLLYRRKSKNFIPLAVSAALLYYSQNVNFGIIAAAVMIHAAVYGRAIMPRAAGAMAAALAMCLPWAIYSKGMQYGAVYPGMMTPGQFIKFLPQYLALLNSHILPLLLLALPLLLRLAPKKAFQPPEYKGGMAFLGVYAAVYIASVSFFSVAVFFRYLAGLLPVGVLAFAVILDESMALKFKTVKWAVAGALILAASPFVNYAVEMALPYRGPVNGIVEFFSANAAAKDTAVITYEDLPLKFYTGLKVIGPLTGEDLSGAGDARFIIIRKHLVTGREAKLRNYLAQNVDFGKYKPVAINCPDTAFQDREDPLLHNYRTVTGEDPVVIHVRQVK